MGFVSLARRYIGLRVVSLSLFSLSALALAVHRSRSPDSPALAGAQGDLGGSLPVAAGSSPAAPGPHAPHLGSGMRHRGEEGRIGAKNVPVGAYAMKGPATAPGAVAGLRGSGEVGHFLATPMGGRFAVGNDDEDVWGGLTGTQIDEAYGVAGLGIVGHARGGGGIGEGTIGLGTTGLIGKGAGGGTGSGYGVGSGSGFVPERRIGRATRTRKSMGKAKPPPHGAAGHHDSRPAQRIDAGWVAVREPARWHAPSTRTTNDPMSTFSVDVDTASYTHTRRQIEEGRLPAWTDVRTEEMINYFDYDYPAPPEGKPLWATTEVGPCPWNAKNKLIHIGVQAAKIAQGAVPPRNLVFLLDVSGSMADDDRLPLVRRAMAMFASTLRAQDRISIVVYAGAAGTVLPPTSGLDQDRILSAIDQLESGGSTNGGEGIQLAYALAQESFVVGGVNRVVLATDGDFNVGITEHDDLVKLIINKREAGVYLSVLRVGNSSTSDKAMEQLADQGNGNYAYLDSLAEARKVLMSEAGATLVPVADDVKLQVTFDPAVVAAHRLIGYDNRRLAHADFANDRKDAGEVGSGHSVTAIYEVELAQIDASPATRPLMTFQVRYKPPGQTQSQELAFVVRDSQTSLEASSDTFRFSAAVAEFGQRLAGQSLPGGSFFDLVARAHSARGDDPSCARTRFVELATRAGVLAGVPEFADRGAPACAPRQELANAGASAPVVQLAEALPGSHPQDLITFAGQAIGGTYSPLAVLATYLETLAKWLRGVSSGVCLIPAALGGVLLGLSVRRGPRERWR